MYLRISKNSSSVTSPLWLGSSSSKKTSTKTLRKRLTIARRPVAHRFGADVKIFSQNFTLHLKQRINLAVDVLRLEFADVSRAFFFVSHVLGSTATLHFLFLDYIELLLLWGRCIVGGDLPRHFFPTRLFRSLSLFNTGLFFGLLTLLLSFGLSLVFKTLLFSGFCLDSSFFLPTSLFRFTSFFLQTRLFGFSFSFLSCCLGLSLLSLKFGSGLGIFPFLFSQTGLLLRFGSLGLSLPVPPAVHGFIVDWCFGVLVRRRLLGRLVG